jgi:hypothetical protein
VAAVARLVRVDVEVAVDVTRRIGDREPAARGHRVVALTAIGVDGMWRGWRLAVTRTALSLGAVDVRPDRILRRAAAERRAVAVGVVARRAVPRRTTGKRAERELGGPRRIDVTERGHRTGNFVTVAARDVLAPRRR